MSLCYDFEKWTMLTLGLVAISLSVGLVLQYAYGQQVQTFEECMNAQTAFVPDFPRTARAICDFVIEKNISLDELKTRINNDVTFLEGEFMDRVGDDIQKDAIAFGNNLTKTLKKIMTEADERNFYNCVKTGAGTEEECRERWLVDRK